MQLSPQVSPSHQSAKSERLASLDLFRGVAIACVFLLHAFEAAFGRATLPWRGWLPDFSPSPEHTPILFLYPLTLGGWGVPLFFVISGFCIHLSANRQPEGGLRGFFSRRLFRIYPPYVVVLLFFALVWPATRTSLHSDWGRTQIVSHLLLVHNFGNATFFGINPSFWSIAVEAQLYVLYPVLLVLVRRFTWRRTLVGLGLFEFMARLLMGLYFSLSENPPPAWLSENPFVHWFSWSLGAVLAEAHLREKPLPLASSPPLLWAGALLVSTLLRPLSMLTFLFGALLAANLLARALAARSAPRGWWVRHLQTAGLCSYSIYLCHEPLMEALANWLPALPGGGYARLLVLVAVWAGLVPLGLLLYRVLEKPGIRLGQAWRRRTA